MLSLHRLFQWSLMAGLLLSSAAQNGQVLAQDVEVEDMDFDPSQQRRELWDFFDFFSLLAHLGPHPCYKPLGEPDFGKPGTERYLKCMEEAGESDSSGRSYSSYVDVSEEESSGVSEYKGQDTASGGGFTNSAGGFQLWMVFVAGSILSALVAVHMGQKKPGMATRKHEMSGAVTRRVGTVGALADGAFASRGGGAVEMASPGQMSLDGASETPYEMA